MNSRVFAIKIREIIYKFQQLPTQRKLTLGLVLMSGLILIIGTISILSFSVLEIDSKNKKAEEDKFNTELFDLSKNLNDTIDQYGYDKIETKLNGVEENFGTYSDELKAIEGKLEKIELPMSSPVNE